MFDEIIHMTRSLVTIWVMLIFLGIVAWAFWPKRKRTLEAHGRIPLDDDVGSPR
jgi:cytochrome c oxidase cbb3-type subunit IV